MNHPTAERTDPALGIPGERVEQLRWLRTHRLLSLSGLLAQRGLIGPAVDEIARPLAARKGLVPDAQMAEERRVFAGLIGAKVPALALKGALLARTVYPDPAQRPRTDLDVLVAPASVERARAVLEALGYRPMYAVAGGSPLEQETWIRAHDGHQAMVDLHWKLRNHPCLRERFDFDEQWACAVAVPGLGEGARGQAPEHALINACMHWFDSIHAERYPVLWLLDKDLLWRAMSDDARSRAVVLASKRGLGGLLAESLALTRAAFATPIDDDVIETLEAAGRGRTPTRLIDVRNRRLSALWFAVSCERGLKRKARRLRQSLLPPAEHMRERFPDGSRLGLPGLYWRRIRRRLDRHRQSR